MKTEHIDEYIQSLADSFHKENYSKVYSNAERLHEKNRHLKLHFVHQFLKEMGYENIWDTSTVEYDYSKARGFLVAYGSKLSLLYNKNYVDWNRLDLNNSRSKQMVSKYLNACLKKTCGVSLKRLNGKSLQYKISGLEVFEDNNITIKENHFRKEQTIVRSSKTISTTTCGGEGAKGRG